MDAKKIFREHSVAVLVSLAVIFLVVIVGYYVWGIGYMLMGENTTEKQTAASSQPPQFNLKAAASLDYRGTLASSTTQ